MQFFLLTKHIDTQISSIKRAPFMRILTIALTSISLFSSHTALAEDSKESAPLQDAYSKNNVNTNEEELKTAQQAVGPVINFNNVSIVEFLRFVSRLTGKNFIFDPDELQFSVTIISESSASIEDIMAALLQNLRIHNFELLEQGTSFIIHQNKDMRGPTKLYIDGIELEKEPQLATRVFLVKYADITRMGAIIKNMTSPDAIVEILEDTKRVVITDLATNIKKISDLIHSIDSPSSGIEIGQYAIQNATPASIIAVTQQIMEPIVGTQPFSLVAHPASNSIFIISTPFFVEKALSIIQSIDVSDNITRVFSFDSMRFNVEEAQKNAEAIKQKQLLEDQKTGFTDEEINQLSDDQIKRILLEKGYTPEQIMRMSEEQVRKLLKEPLGATGHNIRTEIRKRKLFESNLPIGQVESTRFLIHKLQYRKSSEVASALKAIASSLKAGVGEQDNYGPQTELVISLDSISTIDESNALVISGTTSTLNKIRDLIAQVDLPVRQVFIEVLVLDTTIDNSLNFGIEWGAKLQRHNAAVQLGLVDTNSSIPASLNAVTQTTPNPMDPVALATGFSAGSIGRRIKFHNTGFVSFAALINALRSDTDTKIIMNPKITTEHNVPSEVFVGSQIGIKGQSVSNNNGNILTTNFETRNTGIQLNVTPLISSHQTVTLIIEQKISSADATQVNSQGQANAPPATINETRTRTRVHLPSGYFLVMSGMIQERRTTTKNQIPCLGGLPLVGNLFANTTGVNDTRNLMLFIRPMIIDTDLDIEEITRKQQQIVEDKSIPIHKSRTVIDDLQEMLNLTLRNEIDDAVVQPLLA